MRSASVLDIQDSMSWSPSRTPSFFNVHIPAPPCARVHRFPHIVQYQLPRPIHSPTGSPVITPYLCPQDWPWSPSPKPFFMFCHPKNIASFFPTETTSFFFSAPDIYPELSTHPNTVLSSFFLLQKPSEAHQQKVANSWQYTVNSRSMITRRV